MEGLYEIVPVMLISSVPFGGMVLMQVLLLLRMVAVHFRIVSMQVP